MPRYIQMSLALTILLLGMESAFCGQNAAKSASPSKPQVGWLRSVFGNLSWDEAASVVSSPEEASARVRHQVRYKEDLDEEWASGRATWERGFGDCEDFAACVADLCKQAGLDATVAILIFRPEGSCEAHAVAVGTWKGKLWVSSNGWFFDVSSMKDAQERIAKQIGWRGNKPIVVEPLINAVSPTVVAANSPKSPMHVPLFDF